MSTGIFELDEERENSNDTTLCVKRESSPSPSPRSSPPPADAARQSSSASAGHGQSQPPPSLQIPTPGQPNLFSPAPQYTSNLARKHGASFAATPSFPSPLAQAITVPSHSDTSSSSSHSDGEDEHSDTAPVSPTRSNASGTPKRQVELLPRPRTASPHTSRSNSPSSSQKSASRPPSPSRQAVLTPSSLLMAKKRSSGAGLATQSVIAVAPIKRDSPPRATQSATATPSRLSPTSATSPRQIASNRGNPMASPSIESASPTDSRRRTSSGSNASLGVPSYSSPSMPGASSPLAFGSFDLSPQHRSVGEASVPSTRRRSVTSRTGSVSSGHSPVRETKDPSNILGLGWGGAWESGSSSSGSVSGNVRDNKGKAKEGAAGQGGLSSGPPSPRISTRERERTAPAGSNVGSPSRQRRPSEFLNPTALDARKMPIMGAGRAGNNHAPSLSTSASMISPLNPLPSPWSTGDHSPFSPPTSEQSISTSMSSVGGGAIRLNRVPTSVRMAADLLKPSSPAAAPAAIPTANSTTVPTPNPSPAGSVPSTSSMPPPPPPNRTLGHFSSMPEPSSKPSTGLGLIDTTTKGRSSGLRRPSVDLSPTAGSDARQSGTVPVDLTNRRSTSGSSLAPPTSFKDPVPAVKSTVAVQSDSAPVTSRPEPFSQNARTHRYRTSMHEATFKRPLDLTDPPALWTASSASGSSTSSGQNNTEPPTATADKKGSMGLGLNMPPGLARTSSSINTGPGTHGPAQSGLHQPTQRFRSVTTKGLQMDLAGIPNLSDAASHASMIMQSRQAKLQRWRPSSSGSNSAGGDSLPPAFHRSTTSATPAMLAAPRVGRQTEWGLQIPPIATSAVSSPGEDLPPFPSALRDTNPGSNLDSTPALGSRIAGGSPVKSNSGPSRFASPPSALPELGVSMERAHSGSGSVAGIEWVDWYDCYKGYKEAKIRAEAQTANLGGRPLQSGVHNPEGTSPNANTPSTSPEMPESIGTMGAREIDLTSNYDNSSAVALTPQTSRDDAALGQGQIRKRSMSIRSTLSSMDPTKSPRQHRTSIFERPRQSSGSSVRSTAVDSGVSGGVKKKKNLVNKMEGWWSAVKSNFIPENQQNIQQIRAKNLGVYPQQRIPSAPASRRGSGNSPIAPPPTALLAPNPTRRASGQSVRQVISHAELRPKNTEHEAHRLQAAASIISSTSADIAKLSRQSSLRSTASNLLSASQTLGRKPSIVPEETSPSRATETLESRRKGNFNLRLDLESNVISRPTSRVALSSGESSSQKKTATVSAGGPNRPSQTSSRSTSYGQPLTGPGLTPGLPKWDQTPSPIFALDTAESTSRGDKEDRPVAPGAEITVANVRRHIKRRLDAAKATCDTTLRKSIEAITKFAEQQRAGEQSANLALAAATSALITGESNGTEPKDYFEAMSDSPLVDAEDSDFEGLDTLSNHLAGRHASSSRPSSRRPSISITAGSSPTKRLAMLPTSPSRVRRRPSNQPQSFPGQHRISRNLSLSLDRTASASSSRSTSRSRSPLPLSRPMFSGPSDDAADGDRQFLSALQELIVLATEVSDSSVTALAAKPGTCSDLIQKLQRVGMNWDEHDDWPGREWYVDILMAVANLSRVLDWWEAEKGFWNFGDEDENEPIMFVMKPGGQMKEDSRFDREFGAALTDRRTSPAGVPGNDLLQVPEPPSTASTVETTLVDSAPGTAKQGDGTPKAVTADDLKALAEQAKSVNIVMELSLQGEEIQYVNDAIMEVIGREPEDVLNCPITELLAPADASVFSEATHKLLEDDSNTIQCRFRFEVHDLESGAHPPLQPGPVYIELEGAGMLMREQNEPSHTMWVLKPVTATKAHMDSISEAIFPRDGVISTEGILCRICEREIVTWFFEKHNETCDAVHRLEAEILSCNECLHDLGQTVSKLSAELNEIAVPVEGQTPAGQGVVFFTFPDSLTDGDEATVPSEPQGIEVRKVEVDHVQEVCSIVSMASQIEVPVVQEDEADLPFHVQRYLSKESEEKLQRLTRWQRPPTNDRALSLLLTQVEEQIRRKNKAIARMQSTIRYSEKTRHEWEDKVNQMFADGDEASPSESGSGSDLGGDGPQSPSSPEGGELANQQAQAPDVSPPGYRKIAPQARLPITQSHPQRPSTGHGAETSSMLNAPPTPHAFGTPKPTVPVPSSATLPSQSTLLPTSHVPPPTPLPPTSQSGTSETGLSPHLSPGLMPFEPIGHARRASSSRAFRDPLLSPRIPSAALHSRAPAPSIKDFEIIKPISRGAFGSVYLAKKVATGDYFAIKALKKSDMIAKNQITNVKAERTILMNQASSPYVAKLFFSFQSKDYLYLVMEYLNGGDCANLVKTLGGLSEDWARNYIAEVVLGLEYLHARNIVHRDIKPDNLLIDSRGHLKLTDFGLSRIGLLNRQVGGPRPAFLRGTSLRASSKGRFGQQDGLSSSPESPMLSPELDMLPAPQFSNLSQSYFTPTELGSADESSGSESAGIIPKHMRTLSMATKSTEAKTPPRFVGTPDYLAPESILGIGTDDKAVDWWALGVVMYEFLYGVPPFHAETPEKVFDNVVSRRINWYEEEIDVSPAARDLMDRLMCSDPLKRLGARGADEVKEHAFFAEIDWKTVMTSEASFVPDVTDPESTDYFDKRGATHGFHDDDTAPAVLKQPEGRIIEANSPVVDRETSAIIDDMASQDDFGTFEYKNLPVLKQANDEMIRKLRTDSLVPLSASLEAAPTMTRRPRSLSIKLRDRARRKLSDSAQPMLLGGPPSPATSASSAASTPSRAGVQPSTPSAVVIQHQHFRRPSELNALDRVKSTDESEIIRRSSAPTRIRAGSGGSSTSDQSTSMDLWRKKRQVSLNAETPPSAVLSVNAGSPESHSGISSQMGDRTLDILIAEDNPISQKILETLLTRMGCRCVCVEDGPQALAATMGSIRFDVIICDIHMPVVNGEQVARMIRSTNNHNQNTPIIACTSYEQHPTISEEGTLFSAVLAKPVTKTDIVKCLGKLGFVLSSTGSTSSAGTDASTTYPSQAYTYTT